MADQSLIIISRKNPAAVTLGRLGGLKGGKARAAKLTKKQRSQAARKAAKARWNKTNIYKLQRSLDTPPTMLVYNKDKSQKWLGPLTKEVKDLMGSQFKIFVYGKVGSDGKIGIDGYAPLQDW